MHKDSNQIQQYFSAEKQPTLWQALPALEELQTAWEKRRNALKYALYKSALNAGLAKLGKYYSRLDEKPGFVLALGKILFLEFNCLRLLTIKTVQSFIRTTSSPTSNLHGAGPRSKPQRSEEGTLSQRTGRMRRGRSLRKL
jgi:hypothetical protein